MSLKMSDEQRAIYRKRAEEVTDSMFLCDFGYSNETVTLLRELITLFEERAYMEGYGTGSLDIIERLETALESK